MANRDCGSCSLCCKILGIAALDKPVGQWCPNCVQGQGCAIYADRLARRGYNLILVARNRSRLEELAKRLSGETGCARRFSTIGAYAGRNVFPILFRNSHDSGVARR